MYCKKMKDPKRIALVCTSVNALGGKSTHLMNMYRHLNGGDFKVSVICCSSVESDLNKFMLDNGVRQEDLILLSRLNKRFILPLIFELKNLFKVRNIDIVHLFQVQSDVLGGIAARLAGIKNIISQYESKAVEDNISIFQQLFYRITNFFIKGWFKKTVVVSHGLKQELILEKFRKQDSIEVIHLGIDVPDEYRNRRFSFANLKNKKPIIGTIATLIRAKGVDRFISIMPLILERLPESNFLIIGKGTEERNLRDMINRLNLKEKVQILQIPWTERVFGVLENMDIFVMPSVREGCPTVLLEALAFARPVITSKIEGIKDIIEDGKNGLLADTADSVLFAEKVLNLCENPDRAIALGENGRQKVLSSFTIEYEMQQYRKLYAGIVEEKGVK